MSRNDNVGKRSNGTWYYAIDLGQQPARRCAAGCKKVIVWDREPKRATRCPKCGGPLTSPQLERRKAFKGGFARQKEAKEARDELVAAQRGGARIDPSKITVAEYLTDVWLPSKKATRDDGGRRSRGTVGVQTHNDYRKIINRHLIPQLGEVRLRDLMPSHISGLLDYLEGHGSTDGGPLAPKTVMNVYGMLHKALADAVRNQLRLNNPADFIDAPTVDQQKPNVAWSVAQLRAFLAHVQGLRMQAAWLLLATTGMRRGEVAGLGWSDLDLDAGTVRVRWTLGEVDGHATWKRLPKSKAGERTMSLDPRVVAALRALKKLQAEERLIAGSEWVERCMDWQGLYRDDVVFRWPDGTMIRPTQFTRWFHEHCADAGLPLIRLHEVRHTYATEGLRNARNWHEVKVLSERMGHASVGMFIDRYAQVLDEEERQVADTLSAHILGAIGEGTL